LDQNVGKVTEQVAAGQLLQEMEARTIKHQILVMIFWLVAMTSLLYFLV